MKSSNDRAALKLQERNFKLNTLLEVSSAINNTEGDLELFNHFKDILINKLSLGKGMLMSNINGWSVNISFGNLPTYEIDALFNECIQYERITVLNDNNDPILSKFDVIIPIFHKAKLISFLLLGDFDGEKIEVSPIIRHLPFIQTITNLIVVAQENKRLFDENVKQAALRKELALASEMQSMLIPDEELERKDLEIYGLYKPHQIVGGDYYDFFKLNENETVFCMADVSGKGISAAILMSNFQAMMHAILAFNKDLFKLTKSLNQRVMRNVKGEKFITAFIAIYDHNNRMLTYVNSGHQPALLLRNDEVVELKDGSTVLGVFEELPHLNIGQVQVPQGSILTCFTDGICEIENASLKDFGTDPIKRIMSDHRGNSMKDLVDVIMAAVNEFRGKKEFPDDLALLGIRFK